MLQIKQSTASQCARFGKVTAIAMAGALGLGMAGTAQAQTIIARQDFETTPATPTLPFATSGNGTSLVTGTNTGGAPATAFAVEGAAARAFAVDNSGANTPGIVTFDNVSLAGFNSVQISFRLASFSLNTTNGADAPDAVTAFVSTDGGTTFFSTARVNGNSNARFDYSATGVLTANFDGDNTPTSAQTSAGAQTGAGGISTVIINVPNGTPQVRLRITANNDNISERFTIDDVRITGTATGGGSGTAPVANADTATVAEDSSANPIDVLANDTDADANDTRTVTSVSQGSRGGTVAIGPNGANVLFTPAANVTGTETFSYTITDSMRNTATATVTVTITNTPDAPVAVADAFSTNTGQTLTVPAPGVLANDTDPDPGATRTVTSNTQPSNGGGSVTVNPDGSFTFTPTAGFTGTTTFDYTITDDTGLTSTAPVTITVTAPLAIFINEFLVNPPDPAGDGPNEYVELRGAPNSIIPDGVFLIAIEGDSGTATGTVDQVINLGGQTFGSSGFLLLTQPNNPYTPQAGGNEAELIPTAASGFFENGTQTLQVVRPGSTPTSGTDLDTDNNGTIDNAAFAGSNVLDSIGIVDGDTGDKAFGRITFVNAGNPDADATIAPQATTVVRTASTVSPPGYTPDYVARIGDSTGSAASDFVGADLLGTAPNYTLEDGETTPASLSGSPVDDFGATNTFTPASVVTGLLITELRYRGPGGDVDEFVEVRNITNAQIDISGFQLLSNGNVVATVPANTAAIAPRSHYLFTNTGYSLTAYAASNQTVTPALPDGATITLRSGAGSNVDIVSGLSPTTGAQTVQNAFVRLDASGLPGDTGAASDFRLVSTDGSNGGSTATAILGAPGPQNMDSPIPIEASLITTTLFDPGTSANSRPNRDRRLRFSGSPALGVGADRGTLLLRRTIKNNSTTQSITRLRFRLNTITTLNSPNVVGGTQADIRLLSSGKQSVLRPSNNTTDVVFGTVLETPPDQPVGGGLNASGIENPANATGSSAGVPTVAAGSMGTLQLGAALAPGESRSYNFLFGVQADGQFSVSLDIEAILQ